MDRSITLNGYPSEVAFIVKRPFPEKKFKPFKLQNPKRDGILVVDNSGSVTRIRKRFVELPIILICALLVLTVFSLKMYFTMHSQTVQLTSVIEQQKAQLKVEEEKYKVSIEKVAELETKFQEVQDAFNKLKEQGGK